MACLDLPPIGAEPGVLVWDGERLKWVSPTGEGQVLILGQNGFAFVNPQVVCATNEARRTKPPAIGGTRRVTKTNTKAKPRRKKP